MKKNVFKNTISALALIVLSLFGGNVQAQVAYQNSTDTIQCNGFAYFYNDTLCPGTSFIWSTSDGVVIATNQPLAEQLCPGDYEFSYVNCTGDSVTFPFIIGLDINVIDPIDTTVNNGSVWVWDNTDYSDSTFIYYEDSSFNATIEDCLIDWTNADSSAIVSYDNFDLNSYVTVNWVVYDSLGNVIGTYASEYNIPNLGNGIYTVTLEIGCSQKSSLHESAILIGQIQPGAQQLSIKEAAENKLSVVNPFGSTVKINFKEQNTGSATVYDVQGRIVLTQDFTNVSTLELNASKLCSEMYFLHVNMGNQIIVRKLVK